MRIVPLIGCLVLIASLAATTRAEARCADDLQVLQERIDHLQANGRTPQSAAAAKILEKYGGSATADEVDCYNALARARQALNSSPPGAPQAGPQEPLQQEQQLPVQQPRQQQVQQPQEGQ